MTSSDHDYIEQPNQTAEQPQPTKPKATILYSDLTDNTPIVPPTKGSINIESNTTTETYQIISEQFADNPSTRRTDGQRLHSPSIPANGQLSSENLPTDSQTSTTLSRTPKSALLTDDKILQKSHQLTLTQDDQLEDDKTATGIAVEHMDVVLKQWNFTVQWQSTSMPKSGLYNKFKKRTQLMDLDLTCLLCNRYGEVIETVWFKNVRDKAESVRHQGDELVGKKSLDTNDEPTTDTANNQPSTANDVNINQESIVILLNRLPPQVFHVVMVVSSYHGYPLAKAKQAFCQLSDDEGNVISELALSKLPNDSNALWFASLTRSSDSWRYNTEHQPLAQTDMAMIQQEVSGKLVRTAR